MEEAAVEPEMGYDEEYDGRHQDEMGAPYERGGAWAEVTQDGAYGQLEEQQDHGNFGQPKAVGEAWRDVARPQRRPGMPGRQGCQGQG